LTKQKRKKLNLVSKYSQSTAMTRKYFNVICIKYLAPRTKKNSIDSTSTESAAAIKGANETKIKKAKKEKDEDKKKKPTVEKSNVKLLKFTFLIVWKL